MAKLADYGTFDYMRIASYKIPAETQNTLLGFLSFPIVEQTILDDGISINVYEKSFFGKRHKGFITLRYIDNKQADISQFYSSDGSAPPENCEILIGLEFMCAYQRYNVSAHAQIYDLGYSRKQILSYGLLMDNITAHEESWHRLMREQLLEFAIAGVTATT